MIDYIESCQIVVWHVYESGHERTESIEAARIGRTGNGSQRPSPEVAVGKNVLCLILWNLFDVVAPFSSQLRGCFSTLNT